MVSRRTLCSNRIDRVCQPNEEPLEIVGARLFGGGRVDLYVIADQLLLRHQSGEVEPE
jgi:hypothetical protein